MKLSSKYFDEIRSKKTEKESKRDCESLGCKESGDYIAKSKNGNIDLQKIIAGNNTWQVS